MEEQRQRQEDEARRASVVSAAEAGGPSPADGKRVYLSPFGRGVMIHKSHDSVRTLVFKSLFGIFLNVHRTRTEIFQYEYAYRYTPTVWHTVQLHCSVGVLFSHQGFSS